MNKHDKTVLVVGGFGYIGTHVCIELLEADYNVIVVDSKPMEELILVNENIHKVIGKKVTLVSKKASSLNDFRNIFSNFNVDAVIHLAGIKSSIDFYQNPLKSYQLDLFITINLFIVMKEFGVRNILFASSVLVYAAQEGELRESSDTSTNNPYSRCKLFIEGLLNDLHRSDNSWNILILRYFNTAGVHNSGLISDDLLDKPSNLISSILFSLKHKKHNVVVFGDNFSTIDGSCERDYVHVVDIAKGTQLGTDLLLSKRLKRPTIINLSSGKKYSIFSIIKTFEHNTQRKIDYKIQGKRGLDVATSCGDNTLGKMLLNWSPKYDMKDICRDLCNYHHI
jgi:UDP-glucose 4-epimerase